MSSVYQYVSFPSNRIHDSRIRTERFPGAVLAFSRLATCFDCFFPPPARPAIKRRVALSA